MPSPAPEEGPSSPLAASPGGPAAGSRCGSFLVYRAGGEGGAGGGAGGGAAHRGAGGVAVIFGWVGSSPRFLRRYVDVLLSLGLSRVATVTAPTYDVFLRPQRLRVLADEALTLLSGGGGEGGGAEGFGGGRPAMLYYFSNGGAFVHEQVLPLLAEDAARAEGKRRYPGLRVAATAFDSCPTWLSLRSGSYAVSEGFRSRAARAAAFGAMWAFMALVYVPFICGFSRPRMFFDAMAADPLRVPSLYVYSSSDRVTDAPELARLVERRRAAAAAAGWGGGGPPGASPIASLFLDDPARPSPHVGHLLAHPEKYTAALAALVRAGGLGGSDLEPAAGVVGGGGGVEGLAVAGAVAVAGAGGVVEAGVRNRMK